MAKNPEKGGGIILPVLISVLATAAISAGGFGAGYGAGILRYEVLGSPPQEQAQQEQRTSTNLKSSSTGPNVIVEDGTITWMSETWIAHGGSTVPGFEALGSSQVSAPPVQEQLPDNNQTDEQETAQPQPPEDNSSATAPNQQPSTQPTGSSGNVTAAKGGNTQSGVNINPASPSGTKTQSGGTNAAAQSGSSGSGAGNGNNFNTYNNQDQKQTTDQWVLNTSTKKIHYPNCRDVPKIAPQNYATSNLSEAELLSQGYTTCGHCH